MNHYVLRGSSGGLACLFVVLSVTGCAGPATSGSREKHPFPTDTPVARLRVNGLSCPLCAHNIDLQLMHVPGVRGVHVDLGRGVVNVAVSVENAPTREQLARAVDESGFSLVEVEYRRGASTTICKVCPCKTCSCAIAERPCGSACACSS